MSSAFINPVLRRRATVLNHRVLRRAALLSLLCAGVLPIRAADVPGQAKKAERTSVASADVRSAMSDAFSFAKVRNANAAEARLATLAHAKPNTSPWHIEVAQRLIQVATQLAAEGEAAQAKELAIRALAHANDAHTTAPTASAAAATKTIAGFIEERFLGDFAAAKASYEAAAKLEPKAAAAAEAAQRLKRTDETQRSRANDAANGKE